MKAQMKHGHTPGPWHIVSFGMRDGIANKDRSPLAEVIERNDGTAQANVALIAAAPKLLEALKLAEKRIVELTLMSYSNENASYQTLNTVRVAIENAEGHT